MCDCNEGTLLKEFDNEKSYSWSELAEMTEVCASCGSDKPNQEEDESEVERGYDTDSTEGRGAYRDGEPAYEQTSEVK